MTSGKIGNEITNQVIYLSNELLIFCQHDAHMTLLSGNYTLVVVYCRNTNQIDVFKCKSISRTVYYIDGKLLTEYNIYDLKGNILNKNRKVKHILSYKSIVIGFIFNEGPVIDILESMVEITINDNNELVFNKLNGIMDYDRILYNDVQINAAIPFDKKFHNEINMILFGDYFIGNYGVYNKKHGYIGILCYINCYEKIIIVFQLERVYQFNEDDDDENPGEFNPISVDTKYTYTKYKEDNTYEVLSDMLDDVCAYFSFNFSEINPQLKFSD